MNCITNIVQLLQQPSKFAIEIINHFNMAKYLVKNLVKFDIGIYFP